MTTDITSCHLLQAEDLPWSLLGEGPFHEPLLHPVLPLAGYVPVVLYPVSPLALAGHVSVEGGGVDSGRWVC